MKTRTYTIKITLTDHKSVWFTDILRSLLKSIVNFPGIQSAELLTDGKTKYYVDPKVTVL